MSSYSCSVQTISRSQGRSAPGAAAYRHGAALTDERTGERFDYTRRLGVESQGLEGATDLAALWRAAEAAEKRTSSVVAREVRFSLPHEVSAQERARISREVAADLRQRFGMACSWANHEPGAEGDHRNYHCHLLGTTRVVDEAGVFGLKTRELDAVKTTGSQAIEDIRRIVEDRCNEALERANLPRSMDRRSLAAQAEAGAIAPDDAIPTRHLGPAAAAMERRGEKTEVGNHNRAVEQLRAVAREAAQVANDVVEEERRIAAEATPAVVPAGDGEVLEFELPTAEDILAAEARIEAETLRRLEEERRAEAEQARRTEAEAQLARLEEARRAARERAQAAIRDALVADARATTTRRLAVSAIAAVDLAADAVCDAITTGAPAARRAAESAWLADQRAPFITATSTAYEALEAAREALKAHGQPPSWWRPFRRMAWNEESRVLASNVEAAEVRYTKASDRLRERESVLATPSPAQHDAGEQAAQECVTEARRAYRQAVKAAQGAVNAAAGPSIAAREAWLAVDAARAAEASYGPPSPVPGVSEVEDRQRSEELATVRAWIGGRRPITDPTLRNQVPEYDDPDPSDPNPKPKG